MRTFVRLLTTAALLIVPARVVRAQGAADVSGHWTGTVLAPGLEVAIEIDLAKGADGSLVGTFGQPGEHLAGLPLTSVSVDGQAVTFQIKGGAPGRRAFKGDVSADGKAITGEFASEFGTLPFSVTRAGEARIAPPARSAPIAKQLEGAWSGRLDVDSGLHLVMTLTNQPDGMSTGNVLNIEQGLELPITAIVQTASSVTIELKGVGASFSGALSADATDLVGTFSQGPLSMPLTFHRGTAAAGKH